MQNVLCNCIFLGAGRAALSKGSITPQKSLANNSKNDITKTFSVPRDRRLEKRKVQNKRQMTFMLMRTDT